MPRPDKQILDLMCEIEEKDQLKIARELSKEIRNRDMLDQRLKDAQARIKPDIAKSKARIGELEQKISTGKELRPIQCKIEYDFKKKIRKWSRADTHEIVKEDVIPESMLQEEMNLKKAKKPEKPKVRTGNTIGGKKDGKKEK